MAATPRKQRAAQKAVRRQRPAPPGADLFGLQREVIINKSNVRNIFTPHQPVGGIDFLYGRQAEVGKFVETLNTPGQHALLYGERGVGKSSLANVVSALVEVSSRRRIFVKRCDQADTFETIMLAPLQAVGADLTVTELKHTNKETGRAAVKLGSKSNGVEAGGERAREIVATYQAHGRLSPSSVAQALQILHGLLVVDEADAIHDPEDRKKLAQLIKLLSDGRADFKVMVVGIADTGDELTAAHPSVKRCLREVKLRRMDDRELREIVLSGSKAVNLTFDTDVVASIVSLSAGYPHFTHLLALKCAEDAIAQGRRRVTKSHLIEALNSAVEDAEGSIRRAYNDSVRSQSEMYRVILVSAAAIGSDEFSAADLRKEIAKVLGKPVAQNSLNNYFQRLVSSDGSTILRRSAKGYYRFEDPRTASFIRILNKML